MQRCMLQFHMIESFRHRGLKRLYQQDDPSKVSADHLGRIRDVLFHLDKAQAPEISICRATVFIGSRAT